MATRKHRINSQAAWLKMRRRDITASDIAAVSGFHPTRSPLAVYAAKMGLVDDEETNIMRRGRWFQAAALQAIHDEHPELQAKQAEWYLRDPDLRIGATPDFFAQDAQGRRGVIEVKTVARPVFNAEWVENGNVANDNCDDGDDGDGQRSLVAPLPYQLQTLTQAKLAGVEWAAIAALVVDTYSADLAIVPVPLYEDAWQRIILVVADFWRRFDNGEPPELTPSLDAKILARLYAQDDGTAIDLGDDPDVGPLLEEYEQAYATLKAIQDQLKTAKKPLDEIKTQLKARIGEHSLGLAPGWQVSWKLQHKKAIPATSFRVMRIKRI